MLNVNNIKITPQTLSMITEIEKFNGMWNTIEKTAIKRFVLLKKITTIESIASSNRIEGNKMSDRDVELLLLNLNKKSFKNRDEQEVIGYSELMNFVFDNYKEIPLTDNYIKQMHNILLKHSDKDERHRGDYKKISNSVSAFDRDGKEIGVVFQTATPFETPLKMQNLLEWTNKSLKEKFLHPLIVIGIFIVVFLSIHPFQDGNGRLSRILTNLLLLQNGYTYIPYSSLESITELNKGEYYKTLRETQKTLNTDNIDYEPWLMFFLKMLVQQKRNLESKLPKENVLVLSQLSNKIMGLFETNDNITLNNVVRQLNVNVNTAKKSIKSLLDKGFIKKYGTTKGAWYSKNNNF
jgi:Fic family protein